MPGWTIQLYALSVAVASMTIIGVPAAASVYSFIELRYRQAFGFAVLSSLSFYAGSALLLNADYPGLYLLAGVAGGAAGLLLTVTVLKPVRKTMSELEALEKNTETEN